MKLKDYEIEEIKKTMNEIKKLTIEQKKLALAFFMGMEAQKEIMMLGKENKQFFYE